MGQQRLRRGLGLIALAIWIPIIAFWISSDPPAKGEAAGNLQSPEEPSPTEARLLELKGAIWELDPNADLFIPDATRCSTSAGLVPSVFVKDSWYDLGELDRRKVVRRLSQTWALITADESQSFMLFDRRGARVGGHSVWSGDYLK